MNIIKYVSVDGLTRYEEWFKLERPQNWLRRLGTAWFDASETLDTSAVPPSLRTYQRDYFLFDVYVDPENGNRIFEYRERP